MGHPKVESWDVFISHASEDKAGFVEPLASALSAFGVNVWYDKYALKLGDSLSRSIDRGLAQSDYGLVILSPSFLAKKWPEYELRGLTARELSGGKVILPIWHNITREQLLRFSPTLSDKLAVQSSGLSPVQVAVRVIEAIRPDILERIHSRLALRLQLQGAKIKMIDPKKLRPAPIRHKTLPPELNGRIRLIRAALLGAYTHSMKFWLDGFKRDSHPSAEIAIWEHYAAVYNEFVAISSPLSAEQHKKAFEFILTLDSRANARKLKAIAKGLPKGAAEVLSKLYAHSEPPYDIEEKVPFEDESSWSEDELKGRAPMDKEHFPTDVPEDLIRELMGTTSQQKSPISKKKATAPKKPPKK